eukprot:scaffold302_cov397-Prasinococcus_capsulatus_cf.AAC.10
MQHASCRLAWRSIESGLRLDDSAHPLRPLPSCVDWRERPPPGDASASFHLGRVAGHRLVAVAPGSRAPSLGAALPLSHLPTTDGMLERPRRKPPPPPPCRAAVRNDAAEARSPLRGGGGGRAGRIRPEQSGVGRARSSSTGATVAPEVAKASARMGAGLRPDPAFPMPCRSPDCVLRGGLGGRPPSPSSIAPHELSPST